MNFKEYKEAINNIQLEDFAALLNISRKWKKIENVKYNAKVAFLGSASIQLVTSVTRALLTKYDICANTYEGEYNGILLDTMDDNSDLYSFKPDYIVIIPDYHDIIDYKPRILSDENAVYKEIDCTIDNYLKIFKKIHSNLPGTTILFSNFAYPFWNSMGNMEANYLFTEKVFFDLVNISLIKNRPSYVSILDMEGLANYIGKDKWFDESAYFLNKSGFALTHIGYVCDLIARQFEAFVGKAKKCLVLDLDNTLWGGIVGDSEWDGINLDPNDAEGEAYLAFQRYVHELKQRGIILAVCSKNDIENAKEPFLKNPNMILKLDDISSFIANWDNKATNIKKIAEELNIGLDSMVFFDDNPTERAIVSEFLPEVTVIDVPDDPALFVRTLYLSHSFEWSQLTKEDVNRSKTYTDNLYRKRMLDNCVNYDEYLKNLDMEIKMTEVDQNSIERFSQLTNKSNQFNLRTQRYTEAEINGMINNPNYKLFAISLKDRFSNYGIIACIVLNLENQKCIIENWVMSCRVLKKGVENYTIEKIVEHAKKDGITEIIGEYLPTKKNGMVKDLYDNLSFTKIVALEDKTQYILDLTNIKEYKQKYYFREEI